MIFGNPAELALESLLDRAVLRKSQLGLGYFVIHLGGVVFGVRSPDATLLGCSFDEVSKRLTLRGTHRAPFASMRDAGMLADAIATAMYGDDGDSPVLLGMPTSEVQRRLHKDDLIWAPDGDEAFDDGSCVVQFDMDACVRVVGFRRTEENRHDPATLRDVLLDADRYYHILQQWRDAFEAEWRAATKEAG